jgi:hypothetical protein
LLRAALAAGGLALGAVGCGGATPTGPGSGVGGGGRYEQPAAAPARDKPGVQAEREGARPAEGHSEHGEQRRQYGADAQGGAVE